MRKQIAYGLLSLALATGGFGVAVHAGTLPLLTGQAAVNCSEPSQSVACANQQIQNNNAYFGVIGAQVGPVTSAATTNEQSLAQTNIPPGVLTATGQSIRLRCGGTTAANTNNKTVKLYFGQTVLTSPVMTTSGINWEMELIVTAASTPSTVILGRGSFGGGLGSFAAIMTPIATNDTFDAITGSVTAKCTTLQGSASADTILEDFIIEAVK